MFNTINNHSNLSNYTNRITARVHQNISQSNTETSIKTTSNKADSKTVLGYAVDKDGYFTSEFNKAAGIPDDFKIHSSTMESLVRTQTGGSLISRAFKTIDIAETVGNAYKILSQLVGEDTLNNPNKQSFSKDEVAAFPQGYEFNRQTLEVTKIHSSIFDYVNADSRFDYNNKNDTILNPTFFNSSIYDFSSNPQYKPSTNIFDNNNGGKEDVSSGLFWNTTAEKYTDDDGNITKGGLLVGILNKNFYLTEGETTYWGKLNGLDRSVDYKRLIASEMAVSSGKSYSDYTEQELASMSLDKREWIEGWQKIESSIQKSLAAEAGILINNDEPEQYLDPISAMLKALDEQMKEHLKKIQKKAIETRQKEQEALMKKDIENFEKLSKEAKKAMEEFTNFIDNLQESYNTDKDKKKRVYIDSNYLKDALNALADKADSKKDIEGFSIRV